MAKQKIIKAEVENEEYNKPCPYNKKVNCVQYPEDSCGCDPCEECEVKAKSRRKNESYHAF